MMAFHSKIDDKMIKVTKIWKAVRDMRAKRQSDIKKYSKIIAFFVIAILICIAGFFMLVQRSVSQNVEQAINEALERRNDYIREKLEVQYDWLEANAAYLSEKSGLFEEENYELLRTVRDNCDLMRIMIADTTGYVRYADGTEADIEEEEYFREVLKGNRAIIKITGEKYASSAALLTVPILKNGQVVGVLGGEYDMAEACRKSFESAYQNMGTAVIMASDGMVLFSDESSETLGVSPGELLYGYLRRKFTVSLKLDGIKDKLKEGLDGCVHLRKDGESYHLAYRPMGVNDWVVCYLVPSGIAKEGFDFIQKYEGMLAISITILIIILVWTVLGIGRKKQRALMRSANIDALTGICNRKNTEEKVTQWLNQAVDLITVMQVFLIMDVDFFKEVNDHYGHAVGDEVLRQIGALLIRLFRKEDVLGRVGGDEFVVFMKDLKNPSDAERRAEQLCGEVRKLQIPELKGKTITCSIGMAFYPQHGRNYMELYKFADMALYETKRKGKNGYMVYQKDFEQAEEENYVRRAYTEIHPLTGLYYNRAFFKTADGYLKKVGKETHILVALDIDHFRLFNKRYGRKAGDRYLIFLSECLKKVSQEEEGIAGYLGGDNFCLLLPESGNRISEIQKEMEEGLKKNGYSQAFLPMFGIYRISDPTVPAVSMYDRATIAMENGECGTGIRICVYEDSMEKKIADEIALISEVRNGLVNQEFLIYIQPQCNIADGKAVIVGGECLVRWQHSNRGMLPPGAFIPVLEKYGYVAELDRYVWEKACSWLRDWIRMGHVPVPISVNVSRIDIFSMDVPEFFKELTDSMGVCREFLKIEIVESVCADSDERIRNAVKTLREYGFTVMMDDFGSGYSSLNMLKSVPVDVLKLDMRFLHFEEQDRERGISIVESVVEMSRQIGLPIIVEGIETMQQVEFLAKMGCRYVQGFYYFKPMPVPDFEQLILDESNLDRSGFTVAEPDEEDMTQEGD